MSDLNQMEGQLRECLGRVVYTHKTHEKMADNCAATLRCLKIWQIVLAAATAEIEAIGCGFQFGEILEAAVDGGKPLNLRAVNDLLLAGMAIVKDLVLPGSTYHYFG